MRMFENLRPEIFIQNAKLRRDKKTQKRLWCLTLLTTLGVDQALSCGDEIETAYAHILKLENNTFDLYLQSLVLDCTIDFFSEPDECCAGVSSRAC